MLLASCGWWESYAEEKSHTALGTSNLFPMTQSSRYLIKCAPFPGQFLWKVKERMTERGGNRYFTYLLIAPVKIGLFLGAMVSSRYSAFWRKSTNHLII